MGSDTTTAGVRIQVWTAFLEDYSDPATGQFLYGYRIRLENTGPQTLTLQEREWLIIDSDGDRREIRGRGVLGRCPVLAPGGTHEYHSYCQLPTDFGTMEGAYRMEDDEGRSLSVAVGRFYLAHNLREFPANRFRRGAVVRHRLLDFRAVVADYDLECRRDDAFLASQPGAPPRNRPWYHLLPDGSDRVAYCPEDQIESAEFEEGIRHPLIAVFFDGEDEGAYRRNRKTWDDLKKG
ncbi:MAG: Co2+/Mg2+ efflux protein ApaG [Spirochaetes bacterium]|nr:Co2+/Mg2+ efflux protein ApaG [Spirochaetota bacterium]